MDGFLFIDLAYGAAALLLLVIAAASVRRVRAVRRQLAANHDA